MMRLWQTWWQNLLLYSQNNPPRFAETTMLFLAIGLIAIWGITDQWPYLVLSLSLAIGASMAIIVDESFVPSYQQRPTMICALFLLILSFISLLRYF